MSLYSSTDPNNSIAYYNGRVYTIDSKNPWAEAFIVSSTSIFEAVGRDEEILKIATSRHLITYNLRQKFIMPGLHDAHTHLLIASMQALNEAAIGFDATDQTIGPKLCEGSCACAYGNVVGDWLLGNFYQASSFPEGIPDRKYLDQKYAHTPVMVREISCHRILLNTAGLRMIGIDPEKAVDPKGGYYVRRPDGTLTGELVETAMNEFFGKLPTPPLSYVKKAIQYGIRMCHKFGITSCQEASANTVYLHALRELEQENRLDLDIHTHIVCSHPGFAMESQESLASLLNVAESFRSKHVHTQFVKFWLDGAPLPPEFTQCDLDADGQPVSKNLLLDWKFLYEALEKYDSRGMTCKIHVAGEGSVRRALDVIESVRQKNPEGPRHELAHCNAVHPDDLARFATLRVTAEMSPAMFHHKLVKDYPNLFRWPFNGILSNKAHLTIGSDWILTLNPSLFEALAAIVEDLGYFPGGGRCLEEEGKTKMQTGGEILCRILTLSGAEAVGAEQDTGSVEVGKTANFIAVDHDLSQGEFAGANVLKTWYEGRMVYNSNGDGNESL